MAKSFFGAAFALYGVVLESPVRAQNLDVRPLVRIDTVFVRLSAGEATAQDERVTFISRGGYVYFQHSTNNADGSLGGGVGRGFATEAERLAIRRELTEGQIGLQRDCVQVSASQVGEFRFKWFGRNGRRNTFRYVLAPDLSSGLPACSGQVTALVGGLDSLAQLVVSEGESFMTFPGR